MNITVETTTGEKITPLLTLKSAEITVKLDPYVRGMLMFLYKERS
jgi:hypothetical protein